MVVGLLFPRDAPSRPSYDRLQAKISSNYDYYYYYYFVMVNSFEFVDVFKRVSITFLSFILVRLLVFLLSSVIDYIFYGRWVNVYYNFLEFNFLSDLGSFYGSHPWHWYLSQGLVVVLATHIFPLMVAFRKGIEPVFLSLILWTVAIYRWVMFFRVLFRCWIWCAGPTNISDVLL